MIIKGNAGSSRIQTLPNLSREYVEILVTAKHVLYQFYCYLNFELFSAGSMKSRSGGLQL